MESITGHSVIIQLAKILLVVVQRSVVVDANCFIVAEDWINMVFKNETSLFKVIWDQVVLPRCCLLRVQLHCATPFPSQNLPLLVGGGNLDLHLIHGSSDGPDPIHHPRLHLDWVGCFSTISVCWDGVIDWPIEWTWDLTKRIAIYVTWPNNNNNKLKTRSRYARFWLECDSGGRAGLWPGLRIMARTACGLGQATGPHCAWTNHMLVIWTDNQIVWLL